MALMSPTDSMWLLGETRDHPMHVASLMLLDPPPDAGADFARDLVALTRSGLPLHPTFRKHPATPFLVRGAVQWTVEDEVDLEFHVRHSALPRPGRVRELLALTSRLHGTLLDRNRPLWESHVIEGLADGRVAWYCKTHHSLMDGVTAMKALGRAFTTDPDARDSQAAWHRTTRSSDAPGGGLLGAAGRAIGAGGQVAKEVVGMGPALLSMGVDLVRDRDLSPVVAPRTILNGPITGARRVAAQSWSIDRIRDVARTYDVTINDVVCAMVAGAFRAYLLELGALPNDPLTAMCPVSLSLREEKAGRAGADTGGNKVGAIIVNLATHLEHGPDRLAAIAESSSRAKSVMNQLSPLQVLAVSAVRLSPMALTMVPGYVNAAHPPFNIVISNVPGPTEDVYFNGARLDGIYPLSIVMNGLAVNVTLIGRKGYLDIGIVGCRETLPGLQRLLDHLERSLAELEG